MTIPFRNEKCYLLEEQRHTSATIQFLIDLEHDTLFRTGGKTTFCEVF
jgi:hypothetical protein